MTGSVCRFLVSPGVKGFCWRCGERLPKYRRKWCSETCALEYVRNHSWSFANRAALTRDHHRCVKCGSGKNLEVNHIEPRNGMGYGPGCHHHLGGLETLCRTCHVVVTVEQNRIRKLVAQGYQQLTMGVE